MPYKIENMKEMADLFPYSVFVKEIKYGDLIFLEWDDDEEIWVGIMREADGTRCGIYQVDSEETRRALLTHFGLERFEAEFTIPHLIDRHPQELAARRRREERRSRTLFRIEIVSCTPNAPIPAEEYPDHRNDGYQYS